MRLTRSSSALMLDSFAERLAAGQRVVTAFVDGCVDAGFAPVDAVAHLAAHMREGSVTAWLAPLISPEALVLVEAGTIEGDVALYVARAADVERRQGGLTSDGLPLRNQ
jgi:hypothetical protein